MKRRVFLVILAALWLGIFVALLVYVLRSDAALLRPQGIIAKQQYNLLVFASILSLIVVIPVFSMLFYIAIRYRERPTTKKSPAYEPETDSNKVAETIWWGIPIFIIVILSVITWKTTHQLDPYRKIDSDAKPLRVQVVALQWKWLFIYPDHQVASVNQLIIPEDRPIDFDITSDAPMNSFWIPELGGQIYAMAGMRTELHMMADNPGEYRGSTANISGEGFADMNFITYAKTDTDFNNWLSQARNSQNKLDWVEYESLTSPDRTKMITEYATTDDELFDKVFHKYGVHYHTAKKSPDEVNSHSSIHDGHTSNNHDEHEGGH